MTELEQARPATADDAVDGVLPGAVSEPESGARCAAVLAAAAAARLPTVIRGGGSKLGWGRPVEDIGLVVSTARLTDPLVHRDGDLTVTVGAGCSLARLNQVLAGRGQCLPVDSAFAGTTIGGMLATNDAGPLRHRYGTPRDLLIGITLALADGRVVKSGGTVVKNVAGYDLGKLVTGSYGTLAAIVDATFKLLPLPHASATIRAVYSDPEVLAADAAVLAGGQLEPMALDVRAAGEGTAAPWQLLARFASSPSAVQAQVDAARRLLRGEQTLVREAVEAQAWAEQTAVPWQGEAAVVRCSWLPSRLSDVLALVGELRARCDVTLTGRAGVGAGLLRLGGSDAAIAAAITRARLETSPLGHVVVLRGSRALRAQIDVWGTMPGAAAAALKRSLDPAGILNAGRGPV